MAAMKVFLLLALTVFRGCHADIPSDEQSEQYRQQVQEWFWQDIATVHDLAEGDLWNLRQSDLGRSISARISESVDAVSLFTAAAHSHLDLLTRDLLARLSQEAEQLTALLEQDLSSTTSQLESQAEQMVDAQQQVEDLAVDVQQQQQVEDLKVVTEASPYAGALEQYLLDLKSQMASSPYGKAMDLASLRERMDQYLLELKSQVASSPYAEAMDLASLRQRMDQYLLGLRESSAPLVQNLQSQLNKTAQTFQQKMESFGKELGETLQALWASGKSLF